MFKIRPSKLLHLINTVSWKWQVVKPEISRTERKISTEGTVIMARFERDCKFREVLSQMQRPSRSSRDEGS